MVFPILVSFLLGNLLLHGHGYSVGRRQFGKAAPLIFVSEPVSAATVQRGQRAVGSPNKDGIDIDAALGISWGGAKRCDAAESDCSTNGASVKENVIQVVPDVPLSALEAKAIELRALIANKEYVTMRIGLFLENEIGQVFTRLAENSFTVNADSTPAGLTNGGVDFCLRPNIISFAATPAAQELAFRRKYDLRTTPDDFLASVPQSNDFIPPQSPTRFTKTDLVPAGTLVVQRSSGPGQRLEFSLLAQPAPASQYYTIGTLLDDDSMRALARLAAVPVVADRAALGGKACKPIVKLLFADSSTFPLSN